MSPLPPPAPAFAVTADPSRLSFGADAVDARLGGGLALAALHEVFAATPDDGPAAAGLALLLALRSPRPGPLVWLREDRARSDGCLYGPGLAELGFDPARLLLVEARDTLAVLRAGADAVACDAVATIVIEPFGKAAALDLTATRRLALAAAKSGVTVLLLRSGEPPPSAAQTRWQVAAAPSAPVLPQSPGIESPGPPAFDLALLRHRGGIAGFHIRLEWDRDRRAFDEAIPRAAPAAAVERTRAPEQRRAA